MNIERLREKREAYRKAVLRLKEALDENSSNPLLYDGVIQRFEFTYELTWKLMKAYLEYEGIAEVSSPRAADMNSHLDEKLRRRIEEQGVLRNMGI